jgi:SAM-dependent methyltransferase
MEKYCYTPHYKYDISYWWPVARRDLIWRIINKLGGDLTEKKILEVGIGSGETLKFLKAKGIITFGIDKSKEAIAAAGKKGAGFLQVAKAENLPFSDNYFDFVLASEVLEHIDQEQKALKEMFRVNKIGGYCLIFVPAYNFLWSTRDERLRHKRRYTAKSLRGKLEKAGFKVLKISYTNFIYSLPVIIVILLEKLIFKKVDIKGDLFLLPKPLNWLMIKLLRLENFCLSFLNLPWGLSVFAIGKKQRRVFE